MVNKLPPEHPGTREAGVEMVCRSGCRPPSSRQAGALVKRALAELGVSGSVSLLFTGDGEIRRLNRRFRGVDRATDVLSFPWSEAGAAMGYLGDIVISVPRAGRYARLAGWSLREEIQFLILHGLLHLLGHDHEIDSGVMNRFQAALVKKLLGREVPPRRLEGFGRRNSGPRKPALHVRS